MSEIAEYSGASCAVALVGDLHVNSTLGLMAPGATLDDGQTVMQSPFQVKLWACWLDFWQRAKALAGDRPLLVVINGDLVDGDHHRTPQIISRNLETQRRMALQALNPIADLAQKSGGALWVVRGTEAHAGAAGQNEEALAYDLGAMSNNGQRAHWRLKLNAAGAWLDIAHHATIGRLPWTVTNPLNSLAVQVELEYYRLGMTLPQLVARSHQHRFAESSKSASPVQVVIIGGWQGPTAFVHRIQPGALPHIGGLLGTVEGGRLDWEFVDYTHA